MSGEPIKVLKLSVDPHQEVEAIATAVPIIEKFLDQLDGDQQIDLLKMLLDGSGLKELYGPIEGHELAAYRLSQLMAHIGRAASELGDVRVFDVVEEDQDTTTMEQLAKITATQAH